MMCWLSPAASSEGQAATTFLFRGCSYPTMLLSSVIKHVLKLLRVRRSVAAVACAGFEIGKGKAIPLQA
jgi:hypothetical protein